MVGPAKTMFMDEISTGLDSSTTYLIVRCIRNYVHLLEVSPGCGTGSLPASWKVNFVIGLTATVTFGPCA
jgi:hypothetical protein